MAKASEEKVEKKPAVEGDEPKVTPATAAPQLVQVDPNLLKNLMDRLDKVESENSMLKSIAGKAAIKDFEAQSKDHSVKRAHLKVIGGKVVVGWKKGVQDVFKNDAGMWVENVTIVVKFEDGEEATLRYIDFVHEQGMKRYVIRGKNEDYIDGTSYTLEDEEGKTLVVKEVFLNP